MESALQNSVWVTSPEFAGWLGKRGFHWRKLWKRRWIALHGAELVYMDKEPTLENSSSMQMTKAVISPATVVSNEDVDGNPLGFVVHINDGKSPVWCLRAESHMEKQNWLTRLNHVIAIVRWLDDYEKVRVLGVGGTGIVYELLHKANGRKFAMKEMEIKNKSQMQMALREAEILKDIMEKISHPNIMHIEKVFQVGSKFYMVFPLCTGGELYEHIIRRGHFTETDAAILIRDLVSGINSLHQEDILHLDIKPENILFESQKDSARIKITDFGLSRVLGSKGESQASMPTEEEMNDRIVQLFERGILNKEQLRGTVGYMSPELILHGHNSKAADVFAAGVVLYILLCGHPPFHSKSNREVLERTSRGQYTLSGPQWNDVSSEAKELVKRMLEKSPRKRITAQEVLDHSWLKGLPDSPDAHQGSDGIQPTAHGNEKTSLDSSSASDPQPQRGNSSTVKGTGVSLSGLRLLSGHVADRNAEKLASSLTRLVSSLQMQGQESQLISHVLEASGNKSIDPPCRDEDMLVFHNPEVREHLTTIIGKVCEDGKLSCDQFLFVLRHFWMTSDTSTSATLSNVTGIFICRFMDQDNDGYISTDDLFTTQALVIQRSEVFLRAMFRVYSEAIWYPGRNLNFANYHRSPKKLSGSSSRDVLSDGSDSSYDIIDPPKFITARHVGEVFGKLGLNPVAGQEVFKALIITLGRRRKAMYNSTDSLVAEDAILEDGEGPTNIGLTLKGDNNSSIEYLERRRSSDGWSGNEDKLLDVSSLSTENENEEGGASTSRSHSNSSSVSDLQADAPNPRRTVSPVLSSSVDRSEIFTEPLKKDDDDSANKTAHKMDVKDFIEAAAIDDVLVQVMLLRPRQRILDLLNKLKKDNDGETSSLETELAKALEQAELMSQPTFAKTVGQATIDVAVGVAEKVAGVTQTLMAGFGEAVEGEDKEIYDASQQESGTSQESR